MNVRYQLALALGILTFHATLSYAQEPSASGHISLRGAVILSRSGDLAPAEQSAAIVLAEELERRTGLRLERSTKWPTDRPVIAISSVERVPEWPKSLLKSAQGSASLRPEGYRLRVETRPGAQPVVWVLGADGRGTLFGVGALLRTLDWGQGIAELPSDLDRNSSPRYAIRGHQLGYRPQANSYDTWSPAQYDQYIRELTFFGVNSIEGIPFPESKPTAWMKTPQREMNRAFGDICLRYGLDYWVWVPATIDLRDAVKRAAFMAQLDEFFHDTKTLSAVFVPSGDPGKNSPQLLLPFLTDVAAMLKSTHPTAKVWLSIQEQKPADTNAYLSFAAEQHPWFGGLVAGPSSPPPEQLRQRLPAPSRLRLYPDVTHNKLSQFEVPFWDQAFALTLGRQTINPRPVEYSGYHRQYAEYADGTITYSDGAHDDLNKVVWSALDWDPGQTVLQILDQYARVYFEPRVASHAADALLALESNWHGALLTHGEVDVTEREWERLAASVPELAGNWRWQLCLLRAAYDAYVRSRLIQETALEVEADTALDQSPSLGAAASIVQARAALAKAQTQPTATVLRDRIVQLCEQLYQSIGLQTSVSKYGAVNNQRGPILDYLDLPLNNRWWLEDQFKSVEHLPQESQRVKRLLELAHWEHPGQGSFYDAVGNLNKSPNVVRVGESVAQPGLFTYSEPTYWWMDNGFSRTRLAAQATLWPAALKYEALDPTAAYTLRISGVGKALPRANGTLLTARAKSSAEFVDFPIPSQSLSNRKLVVTFDPVTGEDNISWHDRSRISEVWLLKHTVNAPEATR